MRCTACMQPHAVAAELLLACEGTPQAPAVHEGKHAVKGRATAATTWLRYTAGCSGAPPAGSNRAPQLGVHHHLHFGGKLRAPLAANHPAPPSGAGHSLAPHLRPPRCDANLRSASSAKSWCSGAQTYVTLHCIHCISAYSALCARGASQGCLSSASSTPVYTSRITTALQLLAPP